MAGPSAEPESGGEWPQAELRPVARPSFAWLLPVLALGLALVLAWNAWGVAGLRITIHAAEGHGLEPGDALVYRGITVGNVERIELNPELSGVRLYVRLQPQASSLARAGSRFWIVRPHLTLDSVQGLETILGARRLAVLPAPCAPEGAREERRQLEFEALEEPPVLGPGDAGGLELLLVADTHAGLTRGAPLVYRGLQVGTVLSVGLAMDATGVEARVYVRPAYASLVRANTRFWEVGGLEIDLGWSGGLRVALESLRSLVVGGVALATPDEPGAAVLTGHRFRLAPAAEPDWLAWRPALPLGSDLLPEGTVLPQLLRAKLDWQEGRFFTGSEERTGWVLPMGATIIGPADLLEVPADAHAGSVFLELGGKRLALSDTPAASAGGVARRTVELFAGEARRDPAQGRMSQPADCLLVSGDVALPPAALAASRLRPEGAFFWVDPALALDGKWHGAAVIECASGELVGLLLSRDGPARVVPLPETAADDR